MKRIALLVLLALGLFAGACASDTSPPCSDGECTAIENGDVILAADIVLPPGPGPHPVLVMVHGSGRGTRDAFSGAVGAYLSQGIGVARYDKRGVGDSTGTFRDVRVSNSEEVFEYLASDLRAVAAHLATMPSIDPDRIGAIGVSQAGWIMPLAAESSPHISYMVSISGAASSVGVSDFFDEMAEGGPDATVDSNAIAGFDGEHGFDPRPTLESMSIPALWIYGGKDQSNPTVNDIGILTAIRDGQHKDFTIEVFANADHDLIDVTTGQPVNAQRVVNTWLRDQVGSG